MEEVNPAGVTKEKGTSIEIPFFFCMY